jgi:hypothetical protein
MDERDLDGKERDEESGSYLVGYRKPPSNTRFKKGQSGNPAGRPKGSRSMPTLLAQELNKSVRVVQNGRSKRITKKQALLIQMVNKAASGDFRFLTLLLREIRETEPQPVSYSLIPSESAIELPTEVFTTKRALEVAKLLYGLGTFDDAIKSADEEERKNLPCAAAADIDRSNT